MIVRRPGGRLPGVVTVLKELDHENRITLRRVGRPQDELQIYLRPDLGGTLLMLASRRPGSSRAPRARSSQTPSRMNCTRGHNGTRR
jgi:hypothetical protein